MPQTSTEVEAPDLKKMTRHKLAAEISALKAEIEQLRAAGGPELKALDAEQGEYLVALLDRKDLYQAELDGRPNPSLLLNRMGGDDTKARTISRPPMGAVEQTIPGSGGNIRIDAGESQQEKFLKKGPFKSLGHMCHSIMQGGAQPGLVRDGALGEWNAGIRKWDADIKAMSDDVKAATGMSEFSDPDGASFVPIEFSQQVWQRAINVPNLLTMVDQTPVQGNGYSLNAWDDASRTSGILFGGAKAYWTAEADQLTKSKPGTRKITWKLNKLAVLVYASDELLEDTMALDARLSAVAGACFAWKINDAMINGNGTGMPLGLLKADCKITASAVSGQGANTFTARNADDMYVRRAPAINDWVWLYNVNVEPQFAQMNYNVVNNTTGIAATWAFVPGGLTGGPDRLKGRPCYELEHCPTLGTEGDVILWSPSSYGAIVKSTGITQAVSMHLRFDYDETAFRWTFRMDGRPFWEKAMTPANGATRSPIVTLNSTRT